MFEVKCLRVSLILILFDYAIAWSAFENLEGGVTHVASASWGPERFDIFASTTGNVFHKSFTKSGWSGWENLGGGTKLKPSAFSLKPNWVDVIYTGTDQAMYRKYWNGNTWVDWKKSPNGGVFISGPTITASPGDRRNLHVFGISTDKKLYHCVITIADDSWTWWENLGSATSGGLVGDPAAVSWGSNRFDIFSIASDNQMWQKTWDNGWKEWTVLSGGAFKPGVGAASKLPERISVFGRGMDDAIYHRSYVKGKWYDVEKVGGGIISSPSAASISALRVDVFCVGGDGHVYRSFWDTSTKDVPSNYGCYRGYCYAKCSTTFIDVIANHEWCYTTKGSSQDYNYVACENYNICGYNWKCAGPCSV